MAKLVWDKTGERLWETGVNQVVLFPYNAVTNTHGTGVAWNGVTSIQCSSDGGDADDKYADNIKYATLYGPEEENLTINAYSYPPEFLPCIGRRSPSWDNGSTTTPSVAGVTVGQQKRQKFGLCWRSKIGNDVEGEDHGYKLHIVWLAMADPGDVEHETVSDSPELMERSFECKVDKIDTTTFDANRSSALGSVQPFASMEINSTQVAAAKMGRLEAVLYGTATADSRLPSPGEIGDLLV